MRIAALVVMIGSLVVAAGLPVLFLIRHRGKKMDENPYKHCLIGIVDPPSAQLIYYVATS